MGLKDFFIKKAMQQQLKGSGISPEQQDKLIALVSKNPELFQKIAEEAQNLVKNNGMDQMKAIMQVGQKYKDELGDLAKDFK
ncbi:MAG: hypothetical protein HY226_03860 [Candidatus Vogelbacteria bacterium]|nr:hypothetical protein [Candidatus Vogelbacteria bacterium]